MQDRTGFITTLADPDDALIKGISKDLVAAHHEGNLPREIELVIALESVYFRNGRLSEAAECRLSLQVLRHMRELSRLGVTVIGINEAA